MNIQLKELLETKYIQFNQIDFIHQDPISIPHRFKKLQDIEIMGFFAAMLAWGQRKTIINKCNELANLFDNSPHDFMLHHTENDLKKLLNFKHRTFNTTDLLYFVHFFQYYYQKNETLETAFAQFLVPTDLNIQKALIGFHDLFFSLPASPLRTRKHIATPLRKAACKRLSMYLRWLVRKDTNGVDFGLWNTIKTSQLICPLDVHVERVSRKLGLLQREKTDWKAAVELTENLKQFDAEDPVKYDFALFGLGIEKYFE
jgi:uncharacterized protein (TIGR02757 family)